MRPALVQSALLCMGACLAACGHARPLATHRVIPGAPIAWPEDSASPKLRLAFTIENLPSGAASEGWLQRTLAFVAGKPARPSQQGLQRPFDVTATATGEIVVADPDAARVLRFDPAGAFLGDIACSATPWIAPVSVAEPVSGTLLVVDAGAGRVVRWTQDACTALEIRLESPTGLAASATTIVIADTGAKEVVVLSASGVEVARWPGPAGGDPFGSPSDVALASDGTVFVVDGLDSRVVHLSAEGSGLGDLGQRSEADGGLVRPKGVHVDLSGRVFVSDAQRDQVLVYARDGRLLVAAGGPGGGQGELAHPAGIGGHGNLIFVADSLNRRIQVLEPLGANE